MTVLSLSFIFLFLPLTVLGYYMVRTELKNIFLVFASLLFYTLGDPHSIVLLLLIIAINYSLGIALKKTLGISSVENQPGGVQGHLHEYSLL